MHLLNIVNKRERKKGNENNGMDLLPLTSSSVIPIPSSIPGLKSGSSVSLSGNAFLRMESHVIDHLGFYFWEGKVLVTK